MDARVLRARGFPPRFRGRDLGAGPAARGASPAAPEKLAYLDLELITFPHFGMSTASGQQQDTGKEDPCRFNPTAFDAREWARFNQAIGAKMLVFVAKHDDGYH